MATHPLTNSKVKDQLIKRTINSLLFPGSKVDKRQIALICAAYASNVLENTLSGLSSIQRDKAYVNVDKLLVDYSQMSDKSQSEAGFEIISGVISVYSKVY